MKISVVIPCRNEVLHIQECIESIYNSELDTGFHLNVFVVDGMSNDGTRDKIRELLAVYPTLQMVDNEKQLTPFAFNLGIKSMEDADFYQIVGSRQILAKNYLTGAINRLQSNPKIWCVGGALENTYINSEGRIISKAMGTTFGMGLGNFRTLTASGFTDTVGAPMYPRFVFDKIGYFDERLIRNQDDDFNYRITKAGGKIFYDHGILSKYYVRSNFRGLWKQFFQYGYWKVYVNKKHKAVTTMRQIIPPLFVLYLAAFIFVAILPFASWFKTLFSLPLSIYIGLTILFSFKASFADKKTNFLSVFKVFPILHIGYGSGYLKGIFHFLILGRQPSEKEKTLSR